ncbi:MAG: TRAP transporter substrate-binding protein DctP [Treponema sp.]|jgi:TRAP-type C4-dicarboxylate transport system substrate-binding protein|nr:TRAP transporter substrate-binding protein DctP [Treponema sp.]
MMKKFTGVLTLTVLLWGIFGSESLYAQRRRPQGGKQVLKIASLVPEASPWGRAINQIAEEWYAITNGAVELQVAHGGVLGTEAAVLQQLRLGQIQGAVLTSNGLNAIAKGIITLSCPFLIRNDQELALVLDEMKSELEGKLNSGGVFTLCWAQVGWIKVFSKEPVYVPADLKKQKLASTEEELEMLQAFKAMGYQMIPVSLNELLFALNGGMVDAVYQSPIYVGSMQLFGAAKNMASINIAPFMGGIVLSREAWAGVPSQYRARLQAVAKRVEQEIYRSTQQLEADVINTMTQHGLKVNQVSPQQEQVWYDDTNKAMPALLGTTFDRNIYERITALLQKYRSQR